MRALSVCESSVDSHQASEICSKDDNWAPPQPIDPPEECMPGIGCVTACIYKR